MYNNKHNNISNIPKKWIGTKAGAYKWIAVLVIFNLVCVTETDSLAMIVEQNQGPYSPTILKNIVLFARFFYI